MANAVQMPSARLVAGSKHYSSGSLRPRLFRQIIHCEFPDYRRQIAAASPSRRVPLLIIGENLVWDSLAIGEFATGVAGGGLPDDAVAQSGRRGRAAAESNPRRGASAIHRGRIACPVVFLSL